jgi:hypothetical protein
VEVKNMGDTMEGEMVSAINLIVDAYENLKKNKPTHELLRFVKKITPESLKWTDDKSLSKEFFERFPTTNGDSEFRHRIYSFMKYCDALVKANK